MAINDDDKKFIKDTIDNALSNYEKKSDDKLKKYEENRKKLSKQEREDYIAILQKKNEQGEATLAQKFEMLKLSVENVVPEDLKDAFSSGKKAVKGGLNQAGRGLEHITGRIMETNPLTALLWQNRDLIKAGLDIGVGGIRAVGGVAKGAALGAAGLFNQALNMRKKQQAEETEETEDDINISKFSPVFGASKENPVAEILEQKQDWQKQIDDIHKILIKQNKEQNVSNKTLSEGLGGLGKTMTTIKGFVDLIQSKQKLILAGVLVGVAALVGLAMWFQNGGMSKLFDSLMPNNEENTKNLKDLGSVSRLSALTGQQLAPVLTQHANELGKVKQTTNISQKQLSTITGGKIKATENHNAKKYNMTDYAPVLAPFNGTVRSLNIYTVGKNDKRYEMIIQPNVEDVANKAGTLTTKSANNSQLVLRNLVNPQVSEDQTFKKGDILAFVTDELIAYDLKNKGHGMELFMSDYEQQIEQGKQENYKSAIQSLKEEKSPERTKQLKEHITHLGRESNYKRNEGFLGDFGDRVWYNLSNDKKQEVEENLFGTEQDQEKILEQANIEPATPVSVTTSPVSTNSQKAQQQTQTLKQQEVAADEKYNKQPQQDLIGSSAQTQSTISVDGDKTAYVFSDVQLSQAQYGAMTGNLMNLNIA